MMHGSEAHQRCEGNAARHNERNGVAPRHGSELREDLSPVAQPSSCRALALEVHEVYYEAAAFRASSRILNIVLSSRATSSVMEGIFLGVVRRGMLG